MSVVFIMLPAALVLALIALGAFVWAARSGQFDDLDTPAARSILDDEPRPAPPPPAAHRAASDPPADETGRRAQITQPSK